MMISLCKGKIHRATVTEADLDYVGSLTIDEDLMRAAGLREFEQVDVANINSGERFTTYVIKGDAGSGVICVNGAAAHKVTVGDLVIIMAYAWMEESEADNFTPKFVIVDENNRAVRTELPVAGQKFSTVS